jgi:hypothetical protein
VISMHDDKLSRRDALKWGAGALLAAAGGGALGCRKADFACMDTRGLTAEEAKLRGDCDYVDRSPDPKKVCSNCVQYIDAKASGACGGCKLLKGPFHPDGYCKAYAAKG